jgi:sodium/potassium/calcium exchanger 5
VFLVAQSLSHSHSLVRADEIAGATLIAASTGGPELFAAIADTFFYHNNIGLGAVIGSGVFNLLCTMGVLGMISTNPIEIDRGSLLRDGIFLAGIVVWAWIALLDSQVRWYESLALIIWYIFYVTTLFLTRDKSPQAKHRSLRLAMHEFEEQLAEETLGYQPYQSDSVLPKSPWSSSQPLGAFADTQSPTIHVVIKPDGRTEKFSVVKSNLFPLTRGERMQQSLRAFGMTLFMVLKFPWKVLFSLSIPDCNINQWKNWYCLTLFMSIVWTAGLCWATVHNMSLIGCGFGKL